MAEPVVELRDVSKRYGATEILRDVSFALPRGGVVTLTGRSGSGKSTLFKLMAGLDRPSSGHVLVGGTDIAEMTDDEISEVRLRRIGLVFQSANLLPDLNVLENVRLPLNLAGVPRAAGVERALELLALVGLRDAATKRPHVLSGGEAQRAAVARALANDPSVLLADEPTGSLDSENARNVLALFDEVNERLGTTVLIVTHDPLVMEHVPARLALRERTVRWEIPVAEPARPTPRTP